MNFIPEISGGGTSVAPRQRPRGNAAPIPGVQLPLRVPMTGSEEKKKGNNFYMTAVFDWVVTQFKYFLRMPAFNQVSVHLFENGFTNSNFSGENSPKPNYWN